MTTNMNKLSLLLASVVLLLSACKDRSRESVADRQEDFQAKSLLQGIWIDTDDDDVVFKIKGDTIYYPDSLSQPLKFAIYGDTMETQSGFNHKYAIIKRSAHVFEFKNTNGDVVKLYKTTDPSYELQFERRAPLTANQNKVIKSDTIVVCGQDKYHSYVQVNPTTYKTIKTSYNDDGLEVETVYFDNTIHLGVYRQGVKVFSKDFYKSDFSNYVPSEFLIQSVLSDIILINTDSKTLNYQAQLVIPDSYLSYIISISVATDGKMSMSVQK